MPDGKSFLDYAIPGASAVFGLGGSVMNYFSQRENRQTQIDLMREQNAFNERMMNKQMDWNSESAKVQRLVAAGLNPSLAFSDASNLGSAAVGAAVPTLQAPEHQFSDVANNAAAAFATISSGRKDSEEAKGMAINNLYADILNQKTIEEKLAHIDQMLADKDKSYAEKLYLGSLKDWYNTQGQILQGQMGSLIESASLANEETQQRMELMKENMLNLQADTANKRMENKLLEMRVKFEPKRLQVMIDNVIADTASKYSQVRLNDSSVKVNDANALLIDAERLSEIARRNGILINNAQARELFPILKEAQQETIKNLRVERTSNMFSMFTKPFELGKGLLQSMGTAGAFMLGGRKISAMPSESTPNTYKDFGSWFGY